MDFAIRPARKGLRAAVFDYRAWTHFAAPRSVGSLYRGVFPDAMIPIERNLLVAWFDVAVFTFLKSQSGKNFLQDFDSL